MFEPYHHPHYNTHLVIFNLLFIKITLTNTGSSSIATYHDKGHLRSKMIVIVWILLRLVILTKTFIWQVSEFIAKISQLKITVLGLTFRFISSHLQSSSSSQPQRRHLYPSQTVNAKRPKNPIYRIASDISPIWV